MGAEILGIGLAGTELSELERGILREASPYAVILFGRNIRDVVQLRALIADVKATAKQAPLIMIDEEGGRVDRLRHIVPGLPSAQAFGEGANSREMSAWFGRVIGLALRFFDIEIDLAPVVDIPSNPAPKGLERRTFGDNPETVIELAGAFMEGLHAAGVASCVKHFPGIGYGTADPHYGATVIDVSADELRRRDLLPFSRLGASAGAVMIGHGTYPQVEEPDLPATLSPKLTNQLLRYDCAFDGLAISDDMEMHAVSDLGSYEELTERALIAGNDIILFCSHIERIPDLQRFIDARVASDPLFAARFQEATARAERYRRHCERLRTEASISVGSFDALIEEVIRFCDAFQDSRPPGERYIPESERRKNSRTPGTGRSGREEWT